MSKERLEQIKNKQNFDHLNNNLVIGFDKPTFVSISNDDYSWLIEQAELVGALEKNFSYAENQWEIESQMLQEKEHELKKCECQNKRYREALESISNGPGEVGCLELFAHKTLEGDPHESS